MLTAITGINWGDEGKGRMVDLLSQDYDIVARYQGGDNAGHTVKNERGKFILNLIPSGILRPEVVCVMGGGNGHRSRASREGDRLLHREGHPDQPGQPEDLRPCKPTLR